MRLAVQDLKRNYFMKLSTLTELKITNHLISTTTFQRCLKPILYKNQMPP